MRIESIRIDGLKGGPVEYDLAPIVFVEGPNGAGKSRIMDAVRFLFGGEPAGVSVDGRSMADLMDGGRLYVEAVIVDGDRRIVASRERVMDDGTFRRSVVRINGDITGSEALPTVRLGAGRPLVHASEDVTAAELARIGAERIDPEPIALLERNVAEVITGWSPDEDGAGERIGAVFTAIKAARKKLRGAQAEAAASAERSRQMFGTVHVRIGEAAAWAEKAEAAAVDVGKISRDVGSIEAQIGAHETRRAKIDRRLSERDAATDADLDALRRHVESATVAHAPAQEARDRADEALAAARKAYEAAERAVAAADDRVERLEARRTDAAGAAALLDGAPCRRSEEWVTIDEIAVNPLAAGVDLCGNCPLSESARKQERRLADVDGRLANLRGVEQAVARAAWADAADALRRAKADSEAAADSELALRRETESAVGALRRAERAAGLSADDAARLRTEYEEAGAEIARLSQALRQRRDDLARAAAARTDARRKADELRVAEERFRRLRDDEERAREVDARIEALKALTALAKRVRARFIEAGIEAIRLHGGQIVDWMHRLDVDGRIGLRDDAGRFWSGPALSAAQAEMMGAALDVAIARLDGAAYRPAMIEADPLDGRARAEVLAAIGRSIEAGDVTQAFVASWLRIEDAPPGAVRIKVGA